MIYHITTQTWWNTWEDIESFESPDLEDEGCIHCCSLQQLRFVISKYFKGLNDLVILHIDPEQLQSELKYEVNDDSQLFPHIYGTINRNSIIHTEFYHADNY